MRTGAEIGCTYKPRDAKESQAPQKWERGLEPQQEPTALLSCCGTSGLLSSESISLCCFKLPQR